MGERECMRELPRQLQPGETQNICNSAMAFTDPGGEALECVKTLIKIRQKAIKGGITNEILHTGNRAELLAKSCGRA